MQFKDVEKIVRLFEEVGIEELEWENKTEKLKLKRSATVQSAPQQIAYPPAQMMAMPNAAPVSIQSTAKAEATAAAVSNTTKQVTSPFVGTYYEAPAPDAPKYTDVGRSFKKGDVLCIVEAMKIMNEIEAEFSGKVVSVLVKSGQAVQYGQPLFEVEA
jgi:acetyl-CoA carboxylase biotin carboxyl carrier protein